MKLVDRQNKYFSKHVIFCSLVHAIAGVGFGIIIARPFDMGHPIQLGLLLILIGGVGHIIPFFMKKVK